MRSRVKHCANQILSLFGLKIETRLADSRKNENVDTLVNSGVFKTQQFEVPQAIAEHGGLEVINAISKYRAELSRLVNDADNDVGFSFKNDYYCSPDADVLYTMVREYKPQTIVEIGCGNSTRLIRQAIRDGNLSTNLRSIDPCPRREIAGFADKIIHARVETCDIQQLLEQLHSGDFLFIDSSHAIETGNDVCYLFLKLIPVLRSGVVIHIHDIFLPYEYPESWVREQSWNEQYLLQAMLSFSKDFCVIWPGYYMQQTTPDFLKNFPFATSPPHSKTPVAQSFWMKIVRK